MFLHKIGGFVINGTDNILISKMFGVLYVGLYSNYFMITNALTMLFSQIISATTPSIGNLLVENDKEKIYKVFVKVRFLNFYIATFTGVCLLLSVQPFIRLWLGNDYLLPIYVVFVIVLNYYQKMMRKTYDSFMTAAGICVENRFVPIIESITNIVFSIVLAKICGLIGIFIGTIISGLCLWCYSYPKFMYKKILNRSYMCYTKETIGYLLLFVFISVISYKITTLIIISNNFIQIVVNLFIAIMVCNILLISLFYNNENFNYFVKLIKNLVRKVLKKVHLSKQCNEILNYGDNNEKR